MRRYGNDIGSCQWMSNGLVFDWKGPSSRGSPVAVLISAGSRRF